uniref:MRH domain-containing protein n=1 Tax=Coccolithus braarudii TaxID=221442 RepID=A0A7S0L7E7_9EUKA
MESQRYEVQLMTGAVGAKPEVRSSSVVMTKSNGKRYRCYLPVSGSPTKTAGQVKSEATPRVSALLSTLLSKCFYRMEGWWTYEFCFMKSMRQFHQEKTKNGEKGETTAVMQNYELGLYWLPEGVDLGADRVAEAAEKLAHPLASKSKAEDEKAEPAEELLHFRGELLDDPKAKRKYWSQQYGNGTACDVTGKPRETEVRLQCAQNEPSHLASIEEVSTCRYVVQFRTALLCPHPEFDVQKKDDDVEAIKCEPLDAEGQPLPPRKAAPPAVAASPLPAAKASKPAPSESGDTAASLQPRRIAYDAGQCFIHRRYNYRGVIIGVDRTCLQSEAWQRTMHVGSLKYGANQPFYHVLPDTRDRPGTQITYVAQENILLDTPSEPLFHPMLDEMFDAFNDVEGKFTPNDNLRNRFLAAEQD